MNKESERAGADPGDWMFVLLAGPKSSPLLKFQTYTHLPHSRGWFFNGGSTHLATADDGGRLSTLWCRQISGRHGNTVTKRIHRPECLEDALSFASQVVNE